MNTRQFLFAIATLVTLSASCMGPDTPSLQLDASSAEVGGDAGIDWPPAPDFAGIKTWLNSPPLSLAGLKGKIVVVDFWTYSCVNCIRTLPYLRTWHEAYSDLGLVIVGVHRPEFDFEKVESNVQEALAREGITWPIALDNESATWDAYHNRYWPRKFLIDHLGRIRRDVIGEGQYAETEVWIRELLTESGVDVSQIPLGPSAGPAPVRHRITRELYAGTRWALGNYIGNAPFSSATGFSEPDIYRDDEFYLHGDWRLTPESAIHARETSGFDDFFSLVYRAASVNVVVAPGRALPVTLLVTHADDPIPIALRGTDVVLDDSGQTVLIVDRPRMYSVIAAANVHTGKLRVYAKSEGLTLHTFTFGR